MASDHTSMGYRANCYARIIFLMKRSLAFLFFLFFQQGLAPRDVGVELLFLDLKVLSAA